MSRPCVPLRRSLRPWRWRWLPLSLLLTLLPVAIPAAPAETLPASVSRALERAGIAADHVAVWVQPVAASEPSLTHNASQPMNPASVMKLVTAFAALDVLGPAHSWTTQFLRSGPVRDGTLAGDLIIVASGDPLLSYERLWRTLRRLRAGGIAHIDGDIVIDDSVLRLPTHDPFAFDGRGLRPYNSGPYGLLVHFNTLQLLLTPGEAGAPVALVASPPIHHIDDTLEIDNRLLSQGGECNVWHRELDARLDTGTAVPRLVLLGGLASRCGARDWAAAPFAPEDFSAAVIAALWAEVGGTLGGTIRRGTMPAQAQTVLTDTSPALAEAVREMNKWSSNVIARQLLALLGALERDSTDMVASGARRAARSLQEAGIDTTGLVIDNGAGLSRHERLRADSLGQLLVAAWHQAWMPEFIAALPMAGVDGTAHRRLRTSPARGHAHIKTGTINNVRAFAGYVLDRHGQRHAVVMMVNHSRAHDSLAAQDALLEWVWQGQ